MPAAQFAWLILSALAFVSCSSAVRPRPAPAPAPAPTVAAPDPPVIVALRWVADRTVSYAVRGTLRGGERDETYDGFLDVDVRADGSPRLSYEHRPEGQGSIRGLAFDEQLVWPVPATPLERESVEQHWDEEVEQDGRLRFERTVQRTDQDPAVVRLSFEAARVSIVEEGLQPPRRSTLRRRGDAVWDRALGLFTELHWEDVEIDAQWSRGQSFEAEPEVASRKERELWLRRDDQRSAARTQRRAELRRLEDEAAAGLDAWLADNDPAHELAKAVSTLTKGRAARLYGGRFVTFHFVRDSAALWKAVLEDRDPTVLPTFLGEIGEVRASLDLDDRTVARLRALFRHDEAVRQFIAYRADERFRPELARLARRGPQADAATLTLQILDARRAGTFSALLNAAASDPERFLTVVSAAASASEDPRPVAAALLDVMETGPEQSRDDARTFFQAITFAPRDLTPEARRAWLRDMLDRPYSDWLVRAIESAPGRNRAAMRLLSQLPPSEQGKAALRRVVESPSCARRLRVTAAETLADWGDRTGVPLLLLELRHEQWDGLEVLLALSHFGPSTLDWDPSRSEERRARAVGRWRAMLAR